MMKIMMLYSYFADGFAYAGEALSGRFIGARERDNLRKAVRLVFLWGLYVSLLSPLLYVAGGGAMLRFLTSQQEVIEAASRYLPWLWIMPALSCAAFTWDGIYIGATATASIRNSMLWAVAAFFLTYYSLKPICGLDALFAAYMAHLFARGLYLTISAKREIWSVIQTKTSL